VEGCEEYGDEGRTGGAGRVCVGTVRGAFGPGRKV